MNPLNESIALIMPVASLIPAFSQREKEHNGLGPHFASGEPAAERGSFGEGVLAGRLREAGGDVLRGWGCNRKFRMKSSK